MARIAAPIIRAREIGPIAQAKTAGVVFRERAKFVTGQTAITITEQ